MPLRTRALYAASILTIAVSIGVIATPPASNSEKEEDLRALLDPRRLALTLCGGDSDEHGRLFRPAFAGFISAAQAAEPEETGLPLYDGMGDYSYKVTTRDPKAQAYFDQGLKFVYGFNHWEAIRAFQEAQRIDPYCAMCAAMEAYALGPNINAPMAPEAVAPAFAALAKAQALAGGVSAKERAFIDALSRRYTPDSGADRAPLDAAFAEAMAEVHAAYPDDHELAAIYAESIMDLSPWDYWERDFSTPKGDVGKAIAAIEGVLNQNPNHPGAIHLQIHLMEASAMPERAEPGADRLGGQIPAAGHLVHMPSHIYFRVGRYLDSLEANVAAAEADEAYLAQAEASPLYRFGYYPHNVHFVMVSAQMAGDGETALTYADKLYGLIPVEALATSPLIGPIKAAPLFAHAQFGAPEETLVLPDPGDDPYLKGIWHYARGMAHVMAGDEDAAVAEANAISAINTPETLAFYTSGNVPADEILYIAETLIRARVLQAAGEYDRAIPLLEQARDLQNGLGYMEPPYWYYPIQQTLGAAYLQSGRADDAVRAFTAGLLKHPNNAWSLWGLAEAQEAAGNTAAARVTRDLLAEATKKTAEMSLDRL